MARRMRAPGQAGAAATAPTPGSGPRHGPRPRPRPGQGSRATRHRRTRWITLALGVLVIVVAGVSLAVGDYAVSLPELVRTLLGQGHPADNFVVLTLRLPRLVFGLMVGAAFGISGALFQTLLRNPLASPDIIGISGGASVAAAFGILVLGIGGAALSLAAFLGAVVVAITIYLLAWRGGVTGYRFVLIGVGIAFLANAALGYLVTRGDVLEVTQVLVWTVGGLGGASWAGALVVGLCLIVLLPCVWGLTRRLRMLQLGDEAAGGLGVPVERTRLLLILVAVALVACATAFAGPIAFVAFVSAPIARRMLRGDGLALIPGALVGMLLVAGSDLVGQHLLPGIQVPVGIITGIVGAPFLLWQLATTNREGRGA